VNEKGNGPRRESKFSSAHRCAYLSSARLTETCLLAIAGSDALSEHELIAATETRINMQRSLIYWAEAMGCTMISATQSEGKLVPTQTEAATSDSAGLFEPRGQIARCVAGRGQCGLDRSRLRRWLSKELFQLYAAVARVGEGHFRTLTSTTPWRATVALNSSLKVPRSC
jgi:hypothetical protein